MLYEICNGFSEGLMSALDRDEQDAVLSSDGVTIIYCWNGRHVYLDDTINLNTETIDYFKNEAKSTGIPYQILINLYLADCAEKKKKIEIQWVS